MRAQEPRSDSDCAAFDTGRRMYDQRGPDTPGERPDFGPLWRRGEGRVTPRGCSESCQFWKQFGNDGYSLPSPHCACPFTTTQPVIPQLCFTTPPFTQT